MEYDIKSLFKNTSYENESIAKRSPKNRGKVNQALSEFERAWEADSLWREAKKKAADFYDGNQLSDEERRVLKDRKQPDVVINKIKPQIDTVVGLQDRFRKRIKVFNRNESEDDLLTAEAFSEALRFVDQTNLSEFQDSQVFKEGVIGGRGWFYIHTELDDEFEPEIKINYVCSDDVVPDPDSRLIDYSDAKKLWHTLWFDEESLIALFPRKEKLIRKAAHSFFNVMPNGAYEGGFKQEKKYKGDDYVGALYDQDQKRSLYYDPKAKLIRVMNYWYKRFESRTIVMHPDLGMAQVGEGISRKQIDEAAQKISEMSGIPPEVFEKTVQVVKVCTLIGGEELEEKESPYEHGEIPFVPYTVFKESKTGMPYGIVRQAIDPQMEINKRRSKALHILNTQRIIAEEGAVEDEEIARKEVARPDGYIKLNRGMKFEIDRDTEMGSAQLRMYEMSFKEVQEATGVTPDLEGRVTNARSGEALDRRIEQGLAVLSQVFTHWRWAKILVAKQVIRLIQQFWTEEKAIRVTDDQGVVKFLRLNERVTTKDGREIIMRNVRTGKYDIIVDEAEDSINMGTDVFGELAKLAQTGAIPPDIVMEFAPIPFGLKQRILNQMRAPQQQIPQNVPGAEGEQMPTSSPELGNASAALPALQG